MLHVKCKLITLHFYFCNVLKSKMDTSNEFIRAILQASSLAIAHEFDLDPKKTYQTALESIRKTIGLNYHIAKIIGDDGTEYLAKFTGDNTADLYAFNKNFIANGKIIARLIDNKIIKV